MHGNSLSALLGEPRPAAAVGALVDGESNGNLQPNESKCANMAGSGNRHTVCRQRAYLFTIDTDCSAPHALAEHCKATIAKRRDPTCSPTPSLTHPTIPAQLHTLHACCPCSAVMSLLRTRCKCFDSQILIPNLYMYPYSKVRRNTIDMSKCQGGSS